MIIVNNASTDGTADYLNNLSIKNPLKIIHNKKNLGFSKANNQGVDISKGEYILCLNNDTEATDKWLSSLVYILDNDNSVGCVGSKLLFPDGTIQHAGVIVLKQNKDEILPTHLHYQKNSNLKEANNLMSYQVLTAACLLIRKDIFIKVNGFDEEYWNGYEDVDLCFKIRELDLKLIYQPKSILFHYESQSGPERFKKVDENINLLQKKWKNKVIFDGYYDGPDIIINYENQIKPYYLPSDNKLLSIVLLTFNALSYTKKCVESILANTYYPYELIIVDNNSRPETRSYLKKISKKHNHIKLKLNNKNYGFSKGNNQGVALSKGYYVLILNNDTLVPEGWEIKLINSLNVDKNIGSIGVLSNSISGRQQLETIPYNNDDEYFIYAKKRINDPTKKLTPRRRLAGFCMLFRKKVYNEVGGFSEEYKIGNFEDDDLSLKLRHAGYSLMVDESVLIHHFGSMSFSKNNINYNDTFSTNSSIFKRKWPDVDYDELLELNDTLIDWEKRKVKEAFQYFKNSQYDISMEISNNIVELNPLSNEALYILALSHKALNKTAEAEKLFDKILKLEPKNSDVYLQKGLMSISNNDLEKSIKLFSKAIDLNPTLIDPYLLRSEVYLSLGHIDKSIDSMIETANIFPQSVENLERLCTVFYQQNNFKEAKDIAKLISTIDKDNIIANKILT